MVRAVETAETVALVAAVVDVGFVGAGAGAGAGAEVDAGEYAEAGEWARRGRDEWCCWAGTSIDKRGVNKTSERWKTSKGREGGKR